MTIHPLPGSLLIMIMGGMNLLCLDALRIALLRGNTFAIALFGFWAIVYGLCAWWMWTKLDIHKSQ